MSLSANLPKYFVLAVFAVGAGVMIYRTLGPGPEAVTVDVRVPQLSTLAEEGKKVFDANCAQCHGENASGTNQGPPLVHDIYNPGHHGDRSFLFAAKRGVQSHHWPYGNMPAQPQVSEKEIATIVKYVRELQVANGITYKPHRM
jgi:mono/diheme cytochrome c family protein